MKKIEELLEELKEDKFRSKRGRTNTCSLYEDSLRHFTSEGYQLKEREWWIQEDTSLSEERRNEAVGSGLFSILQYQNLLLLERIKVLEEQVLGAGSQETKIYTDISDLLCIESLIHNLGFSKQSPDELLKELRGKDISIGEELYITLLDHPVTQYSAAHKGWNIYHEDYCDYQTKGTEHVYRKAFNINWKIKLGE